MRRAYAAAIPSITVMVIVLIAALAMSAASNPIQLIDQTQPTGPTWKVIYDSDLHVAKFIDADAATYRINMTYTDTWDNGTVIILVYEVNMTSSEHETLSFLFVQELNVTTNQKVQMTGTFTLTKEMYIRIGLIPSHQVVGIWHVTLEKQLPSTSPISPNKVTPMNMTKSLSVLIGGET